MKTKSKELPKSIFLVIVTKLMTLSVSDSKQGVSKTSTHCGTLSVRLIFISIFCFSGSSGCLPEVLPTMADIYPAVLDCLCMHNPVQAVLP